MTRRLIIIILAIIVVLLALAVGAMWLLNQTSPTSLHPTPTLTPTTTSSITPTPTTSPTIATSQICTSSDLSLGQTDDAGGGTAGSVYSTITLTNRSSHTCTVSGYPGVSLVHDTTIQVGEPAQRSTTYPVISISLAPGGQAKATLQVVNNNFAPGVCQDGATQLRVYPPDQTVPLLLPTTVTTWCPGFSITALTVS